MSGFNDQGWHLIGKIFNVSKIEGLKDEKFAFALFEQLAKDLGCDSENAVEFKKTPCGMSLAVSTEICFFSLHTFVDNKSAFVDFLCFEKKRSQFDLIKVFKKLSDNFEAKNNSYSIVFRT